MNPVVPDRVTCCSHKVTPPPGGPTDRHCSCTLTDRLGPLQSESVMLLARSLRMNQHSECLGVLRIPCRCCIRRTWGCCGGRTYRCCSRRTGWRCSRRTSRIRVRRVGISARVLVPVLLPTQLLLPDPILPALLLPTLPSLPRLRSSLRLASLVRLLVSSVLHKFEICFYSPSVQATLL
jgi:hypothetical protein